MSQNTVCTVFSKSSIRAHGSSGSSGGDVEGRKREKEELTFRSAKGNKLSLLPTDFFGVFCIFGKRRKKKKV